MACSGASCTRRGALRFKTIVGVGDPIYAVHFQAGGRLLLSRRAVMSYNPDDWDRAHAHVAAWEVTEHVEGSLYRPGSLVLTFSDETWQSSGHLAAGVLELDFGGLTGGIFMRGEYVPEALDADTFVGSFYGGQWRVGNADGLEVHLTFRADGTYSIEGFDCDCHFRNVPLT